MIAARDPRGAAGPWLAALTGFAVTLAWFFPGYATSDTFAQFEQARTGSYDDVHPPLMACAWRLLLVFGEGTAPLFVVVTALFWSGLARCLLAARVDGWRGAVGVLVVGSWPAAFLLLGQVWKDVALAAVLLHGAAWALRYDASRAWRHAALALATLAIATALRHNAWPAVLPFAWLLAEGRHRVARFGLAALALLVVPGLVAAALSAERKHVWTTLPLFDLGAISAATGERLIPEEIAPGLTPDEARRFHRPWTNVALVDSGKVRISFFYPYSEPLRAELRDAWLAAIAAHPHEYLAHRSAVYAPLLVGNARDTPRELVYSHAQRIAPEGQPMRSPPDWFSSFAASTWDTPLFGWAAYAAAAVVALAWRRHRVGAVLVASSFAYALPSFVATVASEYRYVYWSVVAALLGIVVSLCSRSENRNA